MNSSNNGRRSSQIAAALGALLVTASCTALSTEQPAKRADLPNQFDEGPGQLLRYCGKLRDSGDLMMAAGMCERAHQLDPTNPEPLLRLADILAQMNDVQGSVRVYQALLATTPEHVEARYLLGKTYITLEQYDLALTEFQIAMNHQPNDPRLYNAAGTANGLIGAHEAAQTAFRAGLAAAPGNVSLRNNLALSLVLSGNYDEGIMLLEELAANPAAAETSQRNLQLAYGLASAAKSDELLAQAEAEAALADDYPGDSVKPVMAETPAGGDFDRPNPAGQSAEVGVFEDVDPAAAYGEGDLAAFTLLKPSPGQASQDIPTAETGPRSSQMVELYPGAADVESRPLATLGSYLSADANLDNTTRGSPHEAPADTLVAALPSMESGKAKAYGTMDLGAEMGADSNYAVQLASYRSEEHALSGWSKIAAVADGLLDDDEPEVQRADLGLERGIYYRLRTGPATQAEAQSLCADLKALDIDCLVVTREAAVEVTPQGTADATL
jgi:Flp pilus assembly protein TadD